MALTRLSPCKINLLLNILGRRTDGFHELETVFLPVPLHDVLEFELGGEGVQLSCDHPDLPVDGSNLVHRAATAFLGEIKWTGGVRIHLRKRIPMAAGLGGGSGNAAQTLIGLNILLGNPLGVDVLDRLAAGLGSDVNFFLQSRPALAIGRGERVAPLEPFDRLTGCGLFLHHPGFGISTAWAYRELGRFPEALNGRRGRAQEWVDRMVDGDVGGAMGALYNSLEAPALEKYPVLRLFQEKLKALGAMGALMSGSGSTTFAVFPSVLEAERAVEPFESEFGRAGWTSVVPL